MKPWQIGNTTVRSGLRTRDALVALDGSGLEGQIRKGDGDVRFRELLGKAGVVALKEDKTNSVGRKFRAALVRLGFLYPDAPRGISQADIGSRDFITPSGHRFIQAQSVAAQQECFLRALVGLSFDVSTSTYREGGDFSPLLHLLLVMQWLEVKTGDSRLSFFEFTLFVQTTCDMTQTSQVGDEIVKYRQGRVNAANKKKYDSGAIEQLRLQEQKPLAASTYLDYGDMNLRWLKATGLFSQRGRGIGFSEHRRPLITQLQHFIQPESVTVNYWRRLTGGVALPIDDLVLAKENLVDLLGEAKFRDIPVSFEIPNIATASDAATIRHDLEEAIATYDEIAFAKQQVDEWENIAKYLAAMKGGKVQLKDSDDETVTIPSGEAPAYLEWAVWRAFLAINKLKNPPSKSRGFKVDRDFFPVGNAPGGTPDLVLEFDEFILVVEVTLSTSFRQEATEGTSVRNHVFRVGQEYSTTTKKPVYGLFLAPTLDPNTLSQFKLGTYLTDEDEFRIDVVPMTIGQFVDLFETMFASQSVDNILIHQLVTECISYRDTSQKVRQWQESITSTVDRMLAHLAVKID